MHSTAASVTASSCHHHPPASLTSAKNTASARALRAATACRSQGLSIQVSILVSILSPLPTTQDVAVSGMTFSIINIFWQNFNPSPRILARRPAKGTENPRRRGAAGHGVLLRDALARRFLGCPPPWRTQLSRAAFQATLFRRRGCRLAKAAAGGQNSAYSVGCCGASVGSATGCGCSTGTGWCCWAAICAKAARSFLNIFSRWAS